MKKSNTHSITIVTWLTKWVEMHHVHPRITAPSHIQETNPHRLSELFLQPVYNLMNRYLIWPVFIETMKTSWNVRMLQSEILV